MTTTLEDKREKYHRTSLDYDTVNDGYIYLVVQDKRGLFVESIMLAYDHPSGDWDIYVRGLVIRNANLGCNPFVDGSVWGLKDVY